MVYLFARQKNAFSLIQKDTLTHKLMSTTIKTHAISTLPFFVLCSFFLEKERKSALFIFPVLRLHN